MANALGSWWRRATDDLLAVVLATLVAALLAFAGSLWILGAGSEDAPAARPRGAVAAGAARATPELDAPAAAPERTDLQAPLGAAEPAGEGAAPQLRAADPRTEQEHYVAFLALARSAPAELERRGRELLLASEAGDGERVALLRALHDGRCEAAPELFAQAAARWTEPRGGSSVSPAWVAVDFLARLAPRDPRARATLERIAWGQQPRACEQARRDAVRALAESGGPGELQRLAAELALEGEALLRESALAALARNPQRAAAAGAREQLGAPPLEVEPRAILEQ